MDILAVRNYWINKLKIPLAAGEWLFWSSFVLLLVTQFSQGTMFILYYPSASFPYHVLMIAGLIAGIKIVLFNHFKNFDEFLMTILLGLLILVGCQQANDWNFIYYYLMILAGQGIDLKKVIKVFLIIIITGMLITIISSSLGIIMNLTNSRTGDPGVRFALGMVYPTDFAARAFYLQLFYVVYRKFHLILPELIACLSFTIAIYFLTDTRLDLVLMLLTLIISFFYKHVIQFLKLIGSKNLSIFGVLSILIVIVLTYLYHPGIFIFDIFNKILSGRLEYGHMAFVKYNVTMFGQFVQQNGNGGIHHGWFDYFFIDCSFLRVLMMNGFVSFVILITSLCYLSNKFMKGKYYCLELALILIIISSLIDQHLMDISFNILFMAIYTNLNEFREHKSIVSRDKILSFKNN